MMFLLGRAKQIIHLHKIFPKKHLGQNFVVDSSLLENMISYALINRKDTVLEIGAGLGFLTRLLSKKCQRVIAVEIDPRLIKILKEQLQGLRNVDLIEGNLLNVSIPHFNKVVSTPPYSISSPILFWLLEKKFDCAIITFQKEFAERLVAPVGSRNYGRLTINVYYRAEVKLLDQVPRRVFYPSPDVDSMIVQLKPRREPPFFVKDEQVFHELVQALFTQRNKKVRNSFLFYLGKRGIRKRKAIKMANSLTFHDRRVRELAPEDFGALANEVLQISEKNIL